MTVIEHLRRVGAALTLLLGCGLTPSAVLAQSEEVQAVIRIEAPGQPQMDMVYFLAPERMRLDMTEEMSVISTSGSNPSMLMIQHPQQRYIEWGPQQLQMMQQMMQRMPGSADAPDPSDFDPTQMQFEQTGQTAQLGSWTAFEVLMTSADGQQGALWLTTETDIGLFEITVRMAEAASALSMPMAGGGGGASGTFLQYQALAQAQGLPDGRVVRIVATDDNGDSTMTLMSVQPGPLPAGTFEAPAGYQATQMPSIPGLPE